MTVLAFSCVCWSVGDCSIFSFTLSLKYLMQKFLMFSLSEQKVENGSKLQESLYFLRPVKPFGTSDKTAVI